MHTPSARSDGAETAWQPLVATNVVLIRRAAYRHSMRDPSILYSFLLVGLVFAFVGAVMARNKGVGVVPGVMLGFFFGPLGFLGVALMSEANRKRTEEKLVTEPKTAHLKRIERLKASCVAVGIALIGPIILVYYLAQLVRGEFTSKSGIVAYVESPTSFYVISIIFGMIALFMTGLSLLFAFLLLRGRRVR
jgi:hypothetical protein